LQILFNESVKNANQAQTQLQSKRTVKLRNGVEVPR